MASNLTISTSFKAVDKFTSVVQKMTRSTSRFAQKTVASFTAVNAATNKMIGGMANIQNVAAVAFAGVAVKKAYDMATGIAAVGDEAAKTGKMLGLSAESLQEFRFAADRQGVSSSMLESSFLALTKRTGELKLGTGSLYSFLKKTGNQTLIEQLKNTKNSEEAFNILTKAIGKIEDPTQKAAFASAAFSRSGIAMTKVMDAGTDGIAALREEARKYGGVISNEAAASSEAFVDAQTNMDFALKGLTNTLGVELMPHIKATIESITNWITANKDIIKTNINGFISKVSKAVGVLKDNSSVLLGTLKFVVGAFLTLKVAMVAFQVAMIATQAAQVAYNVVGGITIALTKGATVATNASKIAHAAFAVTMWVVNSAMKALTAAQWLFNIALNANPIGLVVLGIAALGAAIAGVIIYWEDIVKWVTTSNSVFAKFLRSAIYPIIDAFQKMKELWNDIADSSFGQSISAGFDAVFGGDDEPLNADATIEQVRTEKITKTQNQKVDININDKTGRAEIENNTGANVNLSSTLGWQ
jgi:hypothetical protein